MKMLAALLLLVLALLQPGTTYRLPRHVFPTEYNIKIVTDLGSNGNFTFQGQVFIQVDCKIRSKNITLHAKDLDIQHSNVTVTPEGGGDNLLSSHSFDKEADFYVLELIEPLREGHKYQVYIPFHGNLSEGLAGYYRSKYFDRAANKTKWLAVTQFEALDARRAFPCFDEPEFKSRFLLSLGHEKNLNSVSNMPINFTEPMNERPGWVWDHFQISERMSTYLVAYMVSDFQYRESTPIEGTNNVTFRIWSRSEALPQTEYAGNIGPRVLHFYEKYFDTQYPLPKQDMAAIPDFGPGAMENWGLITYRESTLLYDPKVSSQNAKMRIASVIAHELAHQWFGNLVTMKWWTDLWLNEGFATYVSTLGIDHVEPDWKAKDLDAVEGLLTVFTFDALSSSHPVYAPIDQANKISQVFDAISYKKGSFLLRMMNMFLGEEVFRSGVSHYLQKHKFGNAEQDDLWGSLTEEAHKANTLPLDMNVKMIMDTWTLQTGYPVLQVNRAYQNGTAVVTQKRFFPRSKDNSESEDNSCWIVPLTYTTQVEHDFETTRPKSWLLCNSSEVEIGGLSKEDGWLIFNTKIEGLYRVNYDEKNWDLISQTLNSDKYTSIGLLNRVQLVEDSMDLAWSGALPYKTALNLVNYLERDNEYLPWHAAFSNFRHLNRMLRRTLSYGLFRDYLRNLVTPLYKQVGKIRQVEDLKDLQEIKRHNLAISWGCKLQLGDCVEQASELFKSWMNMPDPDEVNPIPQDVRSIVYCIAIKHGGENEWNFMWQRFLNSNVGTEKNVILGTLSCTREPWLLYRYLHWSLNETSGIRKQDITSVFSGVAGNEVGFDIAKNFLSENLPRLYEYFGPKATRLGRYISAIAEYMYSEKDLKEFDEILRKNEEYLKLVGLTVKQAAEKIQTNMQWHKKNFDSFVVTVRSLTI